MLFLGGKESSTLKEISETLGKETIDLYNTSDTRGNAIAKTMVRVRGSYALELMFRDYPGEIWVARKDSPMIIGVADGETYVASDVPAILKYTRNVYYIGNLEFARLVPGEAHFYDLNGDEIEKQTTEIKWDAEAAEKGGFEHFMMKEIHEQPKAVQDTLNSVIKDGAIDLSSVEITEDEIKNFEQIYIVACGSAWHVGMAAQYVLEDMADIPVRVELASEFKEVIGDRIASICSSHNVTIDYAFQDINDIPGTLPEGRTKPWGTGQAVLLKTNDTWYGMTYHEDVAAVKDSFKKMLEKRL